MPTPTTNFFAAIANHDAFAAALLAKAATCANHDMYEMFAVCRYIERSERKALYGWFDGSIAQGFGFERDALRDESVFQSLRDHAFEWLDSLKAE